MADPHIVEPCRCGYADDVCPFRRASDNMPICEPPRDASMERAHITRMCGQPEPGCPEIVCEKPTGHEANHESGLLRTTGMSMTRRVWSDPAPSPEPRSGNL